MNDRKQGPIEGKSRGKSYPRIRRPMGLTVDESTLKMMDELAADYGFPKSRLFDLLVAQEHRLWREGFPCLKDRLGLR